jgi:uncharacterized protein
MRVVGQIDLSIHDVMPETLDRVRAQIRYVADYGVGAVTLLVVPGRAWGAADVQQLRDWQAAGHALAGHGWLHACDGWGSLYHRLHGAVLSRRVAEHLTLDADGIAALIERNHRWFGEQGLGSPRRYVPPAWAMGAIPRARLRGLPFREYEFLTGMYDAERDRFERQGVIGFEADTAGRAVALGAFNRWQWQRWRKRGCRISLHPDDLELRLRRQLDGVMEWLGSVEGEG